MLIPLTLEAISYNLIYYIYINTLNYPKIAETIKVQGFRFLDSVSSHMDMVLKGFYKFYNSDESTENTKIVTLNMLKFLLENSKMESTEKEMLISNE